MKFMRRAATVAAIIGAVSLVGATVALAQQAPKPLIISTGGQTGTYYRLVKEIKEACPEIGLEQWEDDKKQPSTGSLMNIDNILNNKAELGIVQADALELRSRKETQVKERIFTLMKLHPEEIHVVVKSAPRKEGGTMGFGAKDIVFNVINDLKGRKVGFWGGSSVTINLINAMALISWEQVEFNDQGAAFAALQSGAIDALLAVGGQPLGWVEKLGRDYKLLEFPDQVAKQLDAVYDKTTLAYRNLGQDGIQTVSVPALMVTRNYTSKTAIERLAKLRRCVMDKVEDIRDTRDTHPKWQVIEPGQPSRWQMFKPAVDLTAGK